MKQNSLKYLYHLNYDNLNFQSSLVIWYNKLIDKSIDELNVTDVSKMVRQNILKDLAIERAIDLFLIDPYEGEMQDGDLLALLASHVTYIKSNRVEELIAIISKLEEEFVYFEWVNEDSKTLFEKNLSILKQIIFSD